MARLIELKTFARKNGALSVLEDFQIPFNIKRFFYIYDVDKSYRGGHRHKTTVQAAICIKGSCRIYNNNGAGLKEIIILDAPQKCLILEPQDWHAMYGFSEDAILLVAASTNFDENDYIFDKYEGDEFPEIKVSGFQGSRVPEHSQTLKH
jgi:hypothetical protein